MRIASTTVQQIYAAARKKLADALVEGLPLRIEGGDFTLCSGNSAAYGCKNCYQQKSHPMHEKPKGDNMRIAVTYESFSTSVTPNSLKSTMWKMEKSFRLRLWMLAAADMVHWQAS